MSSNEIGRSEDEKDVHTTRRAIRRSGRLSGHAARGSATHRRGEFKRTLSHSDVEGLTVTLWVARTSTKPGTSIPAIVTVDNRTSHRIEIVGCPGTDYESSPAVRRYPTVRSSLLFFAVQR